MDTQSWVWLFVALFVVVIVLALIAWTRRSSERADPYATGDDTSPRDGELGRDHDMDVERRRDADFDDDR